MPTSLNLQAPPKRRDATSRAVLAWTHAKETSERFLKLFEDAQLVRGGGTSKNVEQDLLRAMLVFACAGLDAAIGYLMRDAADEMLTRSERLRDSVDKFAADRLGMTKEQAEFALGLLREASPSLDTTLVSQFMTEHTSGSLQSHEPLLRLCDFFEITDADLRSRILALREVFAARNLIIHEMDISFAAKNRKRQSRRRDEMVAHTEAALGVTAKIIRLVQDKLTAS